MHLYQCGHGTGDELVTKQTSFIVRIVKKYSEYAPVHLRLRMEMCCH